MAEIMCWFDVCLSVCLSVCARRPVNQTSLKQLQLRSSNLTCMFPVTVRPWPWKIFRKGGVARVMWSPEFWGVKC